VKSVGAASSFLTTPFPHTAGHRCDGGNAGPAGIPGGAACLVDTDVLVSWTRSIQLARELVIVRQQRALNLGIKTAADEMMSLRSSRPTSTGATKRRGRCASGDRCRGWPEKSAAVCRDVLGFAAGSALLRKRTNAPARGSLAKTLSPFHSVAVSRTLQPRNWGSSARVLSYGCFIFG
jgi:hypothetical protein